MARSLQEKVFDILQHTNISTPYEKVFHFLKVYSETGNAMRSAREAEVGLDTARNWLNASYSEQIINLCKIEQQKLLDSKLTGLLEEVLAQISDRLEKGDFSAKGERVPVQIRFLLQALTTLYDKRALLRGDPTSRVEKVTTEQRLKRLSKRFEELPKPTKDFIVEGLSTAADKEEVH